MPALTKDQIKEIIPHRDPMLLIDEVTDILPGERIAARFYIDPARDIFKGHFPDAPVLPGVYTVECMAQASDILLLTLDRYKGMTPLFVGIDKVRFTSKIEPGDTIEIRSELIMEKAEKGIAACRAEVYNKTLLAASGEVTLAMR